jgi:phosphoribosyl-ATP pyrophosphohydrolase/phosphoribosyl-AMP cyclohydrolase
MSDASDTNELKWDARGLLPAVVQDASTGAVLMLAWMNAEALQRTCTTGFAHFYSRSRQALWKKGETSGNTLAVREVRVDCDADAIVVLAEPAGPTCHTGKRSCFYRVMDASGMASEDGGPALAPGGNAPANDTHVLAGLESVLRQRRDSASAEKSYTKSLLDGGFAKIVAKIAEEQRELTDELDGGDDSAVIHETADLLFHMMVGLVARDIPLDAVWRELGRRFGVSGHEEKAARSAQPYRND